MTISILMSTYNGEQYIIEQLDSIYNQTRRPDEVVISDDCSTDDTVRIAEKYIQEHELESQWRLLRNNENVGWRVNFIRGIEELSGDVFFFSDQDDIWFDNKIDVYERMFEKEPCANVIVSRETLWDGESADVENMIIDEDYEFIDFTTKNYLIRTSGCCMGIKREYAKRILKYCFPGWAHDDFFWKMGVMDGSLAYINSSTILHRITGVNESRKKRSLESTLIDIEKELVVLNNLEKRIEDDNSIQRKEEKMTVLEHKKQGDIIRKRFFNQKNPILLLRLLGSYSDIYRNKRQIIRDAMLAYRIK